MICVTTQVRERKGQGGGVGGSYIVTRGYKQDKHSGHSKFSNIRRENTEGQEKRRRGDQYNICCPIYKRTLCLGEWGSD